ncbi:hypothetical protein MXB02_07005 [Pseudomonas mosselii]|uniref:hypothetical protein n=1 Tax=Pseudomonas mosselii TaxID=78327 RepID=UPI000BB48D5C|nr:hypothetical protein [Pseudomonas mosselii]ATB64163.1 hypothetical protein CLJ08_05880 [Pseudomonas mosselii]UPF05376.1 hypothetical protein MXB02_07005 [Pseudomonas mosselii]
MTDSAIPFFSPRSTDSVVINEAHFETLMEPHRATAAGAQTSVASRASRLCERERRLIYEAAKRRRADLEDQGITLAEPYDLFVQRITAVLEI